MSERHGAAGEEPLETGGSAPDDAADLSAPTQAHSHTQAEEPVPVDPVDRAGEDVAEGDEQLALARAEAAERTADLQRVQAEYLNYKRRVERDRDLIRENATYAVLAPITEVLDTIDRAREHGELDGGLKTVADQLERIVSGLGLTKFGAVGEAFDPAIHDALSHIGEDPDVQVTTCKVVAKSGYRIGDRVVRAAQVLVVDPVTGPTDLPADPPTEDSIEDIVED